MEKKQPTEHLNKVWDNPTFRDASARFMEGLWADPARAGLLRSTMQSVWRDYKQSATYEGLRQALVDAAKRNGHYRE